MIDLATAVTFGSAPDNDFVINAPMVSGYHCRIVTDGQSLILEDLQSTNGTFVNGRKIQREVIQPGAQIGLGSYTFNLDASHLQKLGPLPGAQGSGQRAAAQPQAPTTTAQPQAVTAPPAQAPSSIPQGGPQPSPGAQSVSIGYDPDNVIVIPMPQVSGHHCRLWQDSGAYIIEDLGSSNGTFVNGERVHRAKVKLGDQIGLGSYRFTLEPPMLSHFQKAREEQRTQIGELPPGLVKPIKVGRDDMQGVNDIVLNAPQVSNEHCELQFVGTGWKLRDLGSTNGTYVNSRQNRVREAMVGPKDVLFLGSYRFPMSRLLEFLGKGDGGQGDELQIPTGKEIMVVGRDDDCDITIDAPQVSRKHARLKRLPDGFEIEDLGSANGTYVNGKRIKKAKIGPNDWVGLGSYQIKFDADSNTVARNYHGDLMLQAENVTFKVDKGRKTILHDISFTAYPTEFVGLMGPSGAGKTTLMMCLNGYQPPTEGRSLINGQDLYENYNAFRGNIGYVPQDDIIHSQLTVWEALYYTAKLRLPPDTSNQELEDQIMDVLRDLEIEQTRNVLIGSPEKKGISGGQRKRVNLAQELITKPSLLFLDEPTSGLASADTINVMGLLRKLADGGRTILLTIHQPSLEAYRLMDNIVYLAAGRLVYYGPTYPDSILFFNPSAQQGTPEGDRILSDPGNALEPLAQDKREASSRGENDDAWSTQRAKQYAESSYFQEYVTRRRQGDGEEVQIAGGSKQKTRRKFGLRQWWILSQRYFLIKIKDRLNTAILMAQAPIIAAIIVGVFLGKTESTTGRIDYLPAVFFLLVISAVWFGCSNAAREIVSEQAIYRRERMVNLKIPSYVMSKFGVLGLLCAVQCMVLLLIAYIPLGLEGSFFAMFFVLLLCSLVGIGMGLVLSGMVKTSEAATALVPLLLIPQVILGGLVMPIHKQWGPMEVMSRVMVARWSFEAMLEIEDRAPDREIEYETYRGKETEELRPFEISSEDQQKLEDKARAEHQKKINQAKTREEREVLQRTVPAVDADELHPHPIEKYYGRDHPDDKTTGYEGDIGILFAFNILLLLGVVTILKIRDPEAG